MGMAGADTAGRGGGIELVLGWFGRWWRNRTHASEWVRKISDFVAFLATVVLVAAAAVVFSGTEQRITFKLAVVVFFSLLPAAVYLLFVSDRVHAVWDEYVINLYQLRIDRPDYLPEPPPYSQYHAEWERARASDAGDDVAPTLYQQKFEALFGARRTGSGQPRCGCRPRTRCRSGWPRS